MIAQSRMVVNRGADTVSLADWMISVYIGFDFKRISWSFIGHRSRCLPIWIDKKLANIPYCSKYLDFDKNLWSSMVLTLLLLTLFTTKRTFPREYFQEDIFSFIKRGHYINESDYIDQASSLSLFSLLLPIDLFYVPT